MSRRRIIGLLLLALAAAVVVWTVIAAERAAGDLRAARADVHRLSSGAAPDRVALERALNRDLIRVRDARAMLHQPGPIVFGWLPVIGRNINAERVVADASVSVVQAGLTLSQTTRGLSDGNGGVDLQHLRTAADALDAAWRRMAPALRRLARQPVAWTLPPVSDGMRQARNQLLDFGNTVDHAAVGLHALVGVLGGNGPRTVTVVLMNNAELRGAGGLPSAFATGTVANGHMQLSPFRDVNTVAQPPGAARRVAAPEEYRSAYGAYLADTTLWKNTTMSPQGPDTASVLAAVSAASLHVPADVVVLCDVPAAAAVISATGPVTVDGESVTGDELTRRLLVDAYGDGSLSPAKQQRRRQVLDDAASEAFSRIRQQASSTPALLQALARSVAGRHLVVWSSRPAEEAQLIAAGAAGAVRPQGGDLAMVTINNLGDSPLVGNKLDYYMHRSLTVDVRLHAHRAEVTQTLVLRNSAPTGLGPYVEGVRHPGDVRELLTMAAAPDATLESFTKDGQPADVQTGAADGGRAVTTLLELSRGATTTYQLSYSVPVRDRYNLTLVPQPLAQPAELHLHISAVDSELGVVSGADQPRHSTIDDVGGWDSLQTVSIPVHSYGWPRSWLHAFAHFWTHKV